MWPQTSPDQIEIAVREAGFDPLIPPNRLRAPGALYKVEGGIHEKVCEDLALTQPKMQRSPTQDRTRQKVEKGGFSLGGEYVESLNVNLTGARITSIEFRLTDVEVSEIMDSDLFEIQDALLHRKSCEDAVDRALKAKIQVCPGSAALSATTSYKVRVDRRLESKTKDEAMKAVQHVIRQESGGDIRISGEDELTGQNMFIGIRLSRSCITPDTATEPSLLPPAVKEKAELVTTVVR